MMKTNIPAITAVLIHLVLNFSAFAHYQQAKLNAQDANANDRFGVSVALDGSTLVVGAYQDDACGIDSGAAYVFELVGSEWVQRQKLVASDACAGDQFGRSVAIEADTIVVGAYYGYVGSAYVFNRSGSDWFQQQKLVPIEFLPNNRFGAAVSLSGDTLVVGAYGDNSYNGAAYVFNRAGQTWTQYQKLTAADPAKNDNFGISVVIENDTIIVGASSDDTNYSDAGSASVFRRQGVDWIQQQILLSSDSRSGDHFGCSVALDGGLAVVGAYECDINGVADVGAAYVFEEDESGWVERQKLFDAESPHAGDDFGRSVVIDGNKIYVGCVNYVVDGNKTGAVFEFERPAWQWKKNEIIIADDGNDGDDFGFSISVLGQYLVTGARYNASAAFNAGSVYVFKNNDLTCDLDGDSDVDFADFAVFAPAWLASSPQPAFNPDCDLAVPPDGLVNHLDLAILCVHWLAGK